MHLLPRRQLLPGPGPLFIMHVTWLEVSLGSNVWQHWGRAASEQRRESASKKKAVLEGFRAGGGWVFGFCATWPRACSLHVMPLWLAWANQKEARNRMDIVLCVFWNINRQIYNVEIYNDLPCRLQSSWQTFLLGISVCVSADGKMIIFWPVRSCGTFSGY